MEKRINARKHLIIIFLPSLIGIWIEIGFACEALRVVGVFVLYDLYVRKQFFSMGKCFDFSALRVFLDPITKPLDAGYVCPHLAKMKRKVVSQKLWKSLQPLLPPSPRSCRGGRPRLDDFATLNGILFVLTTGIPWGDLPQELGFGSGMTCWRRLRDWQELGFGTAYT